MGLDARKSVFGFANNEGADQRAHPCRLISAFVIRFLETCFMQNFDVLASLCSSGDWFEPRFVDKPKDRFCRDESFFMRLLKSADCIQNLSIKEIFQDHLFKVLSGLDIQIRTN